MRLVQVALLWLAGCTCGGAPEPAPRATTERAAPDPFVDPGNNSPVVLPASEQARIPPTPTTTALPDPVVAAAPPTLPHVVVVLGCTVRKDQLEVYGGPAGTTPFLVRLATEGTRFDDTIAAAPWTRAASTAILTGRHPALVGMADPGNGRDDSVLPGKVTTLSERMRDLGYTTIGATANPNLLADFGFDQGFDHYQLGLEGNWSNKMVGSTVVDAALRQLKSVRAADATKPVYLRLMLIDAHEPRDAEAEAYAPYVQAEVPARVARYRAHVRQLDEALQRLDKGLAAQGLDASNTLFVFIADHGEGMNYPGHHGFGHGQYFGSSTVYVPWILRGPGVARGHVVLGPASQVDLLPTVLGLVGRPLAPAEPTDGRDWSALVRGEGHVIDRPYVLSDTWFGGSSRAAIFTATHQCQADFGSAARQVRKGKFVPGCYDRRADPLFHRPLPALPELDTLVTWRTAAAEALPGRKAERAKVSAALSQQLEALGYADPAGKAP